VLQEDDVAGLLSAEDRSRCQQFFHDIAVADRGFMDFDPGILLGPVQSQVAHDGHGHRVIGEFPFS
jgi:hypothetical protein